MRRWNIVCSPSVGDHWLEVHHVSHDWIFASDTHSAMNLTGFPGNLEGHIHIVSFRHGYLWWCSTIFIFQYSQSPGKKLWFRNFSNHFGQLFLCELECADWFTKLNTFFRITQRRIITIESCSNGSPTDSRGAEFRQPSGPFSPLTFGRIFSFGTFTLSNTNSPVALARNDHLPCVSGVLNPGIPRSRIIPRIIPASSLAHTTAMSAKGALDIHILLR